VAHGVVAQLAKHAIGELEGAAVVVDHHDPVGLPGPEVQGSQ